MSCEVPGVFNLMHLTLGSESASVRAGEKLGVGRFVRISSRAMSDQQRESLFEAFSDTHPTAQVRQVATLFSLLGSCSSFLTCTQSAPLTSFSLRQESGLKFESQPRAHEAQQFQRFSKLFIVRSVFERAELFSRLGAWPAQSVMATPTSPQRTCASGRSMCFRLGVNLRILYDIE